MGKYDHYEELEEEAYRDSVKPKKKPKKQKKEWKENEYKPKDNNYSILLFNQRHLYMEPGWTSWWTSYFLPKS